jgi:hypothetical protein
MVTDIRQARFFFAPTPELVATYNQEKPGKFAMDSAMMQYQ